MFRTMGVAVAVALMVSPLLAAEAKVMSAEGKPKPDSPMVAAAKSANRLGKKPALVITNDNLGKLGEGAHMTTTTVQRPIDVAKSSKAAPSGPTTAQTQDSKKVQAEQEKKAREVKKAEAAAKAKLEELSQMVEDDLFSDEDPARAEQKLEEAAAKAAAAQTPKP